MLFELQRANINQCLKLDVTEPAVQLLNYKFMYVFLFYNLSVAIV